MCRTPVLKPIISSAAPDLFRSLPFHLAFNFQPGLQDSLVMGLFELLQSQMLHSKRIFESCLPNHTSLYLGFRHHHKIGSRNLIAGTADADFVAQGVRRKDQ